ncbi:ATP-grasp domain-containing protein [Candidatus Gracilibacteria bacterium]|nr:ATP-grasp domain-containing protein [Candidatus Gracilibacteria bacterium]
MSTSIQLLDSAYAALKKQINVRDFRTAPLGVTFRERAETAMRIGARSPLSLAAWSAMEILMRSNHAGYIPKSPLFLSQEDTEKMRKHIEQYPEIYGQFALDKYWSDYIACHENPKSKWGLVSIITEVFGGDITHEGAISIGRVKIDGHRYLFIGHDKNHNQGRAKTSDHEAVVKMLAKENLGSYDRVVFVVDTPGADSGKQANESHQAAMMSQLITQVVTLDKPTLTILTGEGGSGGAEVFFGTDLRIALPNAYFSTIHPIGHSAIIKGVYSPKEIAWRLGVDAPHLQEKGVIDAIANISLAKSEQQELSKEVGIIKRALSDIITSSFVHIENRLSSAGNIPQGARRIFRGLDFSQKTANMLTSRGRNLATIETAIADIARYEVAGVVSSFDTVVGIPEQSIIGERLLQFFRSELESSHLTKFNIIKAIDTLITYVGDNAYSSKLDAPVRNNIVGLIRSELYNYQSLFETLSELIEPKNYDRFFSTSGTHAKRLISGDQDGLSYDRDQIATFLKEIYDAAQPHHIHQGYDNWKLSHLSWVNTMFESNRESLIELTKQFKQVHYDLPETIVSLALLLEEKFIASLQDDGYNPTLSSSDSLTIDFSSKATYERIRYYESIRKQIFGKCNFSEIERKFFTSFTPSHTLFSRVPTTSLQDRTKLEKNSNPTTMTGWGHIGYNLETDHGIQYRKMNHHFGVVMLDFSIEGGSIDGAAAANIIQLIEQAARTERPVIMFLQSAGMYVDGGPEAVSSMTAINFAIAEYFRKTDGNPDCCIFSIPLGVCTGGTIASFAQAPGVITLPLSLSDIPFAGRIVTLDQLPLQSTLADLQIGKGNIRGIIMNPFISESTAEQFYQALRSRGVDIAMPTRDLISYLEEYLDGSANTIITRRNQITSVVKTNTELFHPYKKVAILNRGTIAAKAIRTLDAMKKDYMVLTTQADKDLPYVKKASKKGKSTQISDYMMDEYAIIQAIRDTGCDAVYLGYGFWSERDSFIALCEEHGIVVIGPNSKNVEQMGDKITARTTFKQVLNKVEQVEKEREKYAPAHGSDDILGGNGIIPDTNTAIDVAQKIGYPVMIKAVYGGGGKGIARIESDEQMREQFDMMSRTAVENFGNGSMYMEKALDNQRHIEVQIFSDIHGNAVSLGVRDCTTQRNRQKIIEETGDLGIDTGALSRLQDIAIAVVRDIGYVGAGTFEFLYDPISGTFTFMEMNTRIQVEHTITEQLIHDTGIDKIINLVGLQFEVASGGTHKILESTTAARLAGELQKNKKHVMEVRICAEDPAKKFAGVSMAKIKKWTLNLPKNIRKKVYFETYLGIGDAINHTSKYDSMIGQLIVSGESREECRANMISALGSLKIEGIPTNQEFALRILQSDAFRDRTLRISSMDSEPDQFFANLTPYDDKQIESISELREDSVVLQEGEYIVRMGQDMKIMNPAIPKKITTSNKNESLFEVSMNKVNTQITLGELGSDNFYIKDSTGKRIDRLPEGEWEIITNSIAIESKRSYSRGKGLFIIKPV